MAAASATLVTTFSADHRPLAREQAIAWRPRSRTSCTLPGAKVGTCSALSSCSDALGTVEETQPGSSPHNASTPPRRSVPMWLPWRIASVDAIEPGGLAEPDADDAVEARAGERAGELRAVHGGRGELLVDRAAQHDVVLGGERAQPLELAVEAGQRRAGIAGGERRRVQPGGRVGAVLVDQHPHAGLHAGEEDLTLLEDVAVLE